VVTFFFLPGYMGTEGNETACQFARLGSEFLFIKPEPSCDISSGISKKSIRDWTNKRPQNILESLRGFQHTKGFLQRPSVGKSKEMLKLTETSYDG
jgi:hypothetical protein